MREKQALLSKAVRNIVVLSHFSQRLLQTAYSIPSEKFCVIHCGLDTSLFSLTAREIYRRKMRKELGIHDDDFVIGFIGVQTDVKGLPILLNALDQIQNPHIKLLIQGPRDEDLTRIKEEIQVSHACYPHLIFVKRLPKQQMPAIHSALDLLLLISKGETFGMVALEAMGVGTPVMVSRATGVSELIEQAVSGIILDSTPDANWLALEISRLARSPDFLTGIAQKAERIASENNVERKGKTFSDLIDRVETEKQSHLEDPHNLKFRSKTI